jgi:carbon-monoxide dehydrogenase large subunit
MVARAGARFTGASVKRSEDPRILTGRGNYIDDVTMPNMAYAAFLRSPFAHARITAVDTEQARQADGVLAVITGAQMQRLLTDGGYGAGGLFGIEKPAYSALATDKVRFVGDPVAVVVAESRHLAEDACELIEVDYDPLPAVVTIDQALDPARPPVFDELGSNVIGGPTTNVFGDVDGAFARADRVVRETLTQHRYQNVPMECRGVVADYDPASGQFLIWSANQGVQPARKGFADRLGVPIEKVRVRAGDIGGSFGLKIGAGREDVAVAAASREVGRPVKWFEDRFEHMCSAGQARDERVEIEAAITNDGDILALRVNLTMDAGSYPGLASVADHEAMEMLPGAYKIGAVSYTSTLVVTNKASYVAYRGPWAVETFVRERLVDIIAAELGKDALEIRLRNVATGEAPGTIVVTGLSLAGVTVKESLEQIAEVIDLPAFRRRQAEARQEGRYLGLGMASFIEHAPGPRRAPDVPLSILGPEPIRMKLADDGHLVVYTGQMPSGHGHQTTMAQIAADEFGVAYEDVEVVIGDTDVVPASLTGGSNFANLAGGASLVAARSLRGKVIEAAGHLLEASPEDVEIRDGSVGVRGVPSSAVTLAQVVAAAREPGRLPEDVDTSFEVAENYLGGEGGWSGGTHAAIVEVDAVTGMVRIDRYVAVMDCGELINPAVVDGQIRGGVAQGIGAVLFEKSAYDEESGQFLSATFMDYLLPTAVEVPRIETHYLQTVPLDPLVNFRGVGEGGLIVSTPTLCNAIADALAPFGARVCEEYLPPARILELAGVIPEA